jgi:hypothetical protein
MSKVNMEILSKVFPYFDHVNKHSNYLDFSRTCPSQIVKALLFPLHYFRNLRT